MKTFKDSVDKIIHEGMNTVSVERTDQGDSNIAGTVSDQPIQAASSALSSRDNASPGNYERDGTAATLTLGATGAAADGNDSAQPTSTASISEPIKPEFPLSKGTLKKIRLNPKAPELPRSAYYYFVMVQQTQVQAPQYLANAWEKLPESEKSTFLEMAYVDQARYDRCCIQRGALAASKEGGERSICSEAALIFVLVVLQRTSRPPCSSVPDSNQR